MSCDACRVYHYKCDDGWPSCSRCARVGRRCVRQTQFRFKNAEADSTSFPRSQEWVSPPGDVVFINENAKVKDEYDFKAAVSEPNTVRRQSAPHSNSSVETKENDAAREHDDSLGPKLPGSPRVSLWPVEIDHEAVLIRHFAETVSHFFDFCDPKRHFRRIVPQRARSNSILASAVLALSARHLSRTTTFDALVADEHYHRCLQQLIPALAGDAKDDTLLAATVILRLMEELDVPINGRDSQNHLAGTHAIVRAQDQQLRNPSDPSGLLEAAHWAALRQDLYVSLTAQRPMQLASLDLFRAVYQPKNSVDRTANSDDQDAEWSNLAVLQCCDVLQFVFGSDSRDEKQYNRLKTINDDWRRYKPMSFDPFYSRRDTPTGLPDIRLLADWYVMGYMYNLLAQLLLVVHNPAAMDGDHICARSLSEDIRQTVREMAGIALSNPNCPSAMLVASMAISMYGDRFESPNEQGKLHDILLDTEKVHGWPTRSARRALTQFRSYEPA